MAVTTLLNSISVPVGGSRIVHVSASGLLSKRTARKREAVIAAQVGGASGSIVSYTDAVLELSAADLCAASMEAHRNKQCVPMAFLVSAWQLSVMREFAYLLGQQGHLRAAFVALEPAQRWLEQQAAVMRLLPARAAVAHPHQTLHQAPAMLM